MITLLFLMAPMVWLGLSAEELDRSTRRRLFICLTAICGVELLRRLV